MKENRIVSFIIVFLVYVVATISGIIVFNNLNFHYAINILIADIIATVIVYIFSLIFNNASVYDPYWSVQPIVIVWLMLFTTEVNAERLLALIAITLWGIRLTLNWAYTFKNLLHQDWRYTMLKEKTKVFYPVVNLLGIHMFPTIVVYLCMLPVIFMYHENTSFSPLVVLFFTLAVLSFVLQGASDYQMHKFRKNRSSVFIRDGLWKYSRHPNYLGEILMWWSIALMCVISLGGMYNLFLGALVNTLMFVFVSIPMAEKHQANRKPGFEEYKKETRMLLPIKK